MTYAWALRRQHDLTDINEIANICLLAMAGLVVLFTLLYVTRSMWRSNWIGKIFAFKSVVLSTVLVQVSLSVWLGSDYPGRGWIRLAIYAGGAVAFVPMIVSLVIMQRRDRAQAREVVRGRRS